MKEKGTIKYETRNKVKDGKENWERISEGEVVKYETK